MPAKQDNRDKRPSGGDILDPMDPTQYNSRGNPLLGSDPWLHARDTRNRPGDIAPPSGDPSGVNMDEYTSGLMAQLLGLMDQQANTDLANSQISQLSSILSQRSALAGKDLAAGTFASGGATAANISGILRGEQQALSQGITQIQGDALARSQSNQATALGMMLNLRGQLSAENQADFDNRLATAQFEFEKWKTEEGFRLTEEEIEARRMSFIIEAIGAIIPG